MRGPWGPARAAGEGACAAHEGQEQVHAEVSTLRGSPVHTQSQKHGNHLGCPFVQIPGLPPAPTPTAPWAGP